MFRMRYKFVGMSEPISFQGTSASPHVKRTRIFCTLGQPKASHCPGWRDEGYHLPFSSGTQSVAKFSSRFLVLEKERKAEQKRKKIIGENRVLG